MKIEFEYTSGLSIIIDIMIVQPFEHLIDWQKLITEVHCSCALSLSLSLSLILGSSLKMEYLNMQHYTISELPYLVLYLPWLW